jgi:hypothetical protein
MADFVRRGERGAKYVLEFLIFCLFKIFLVDYYRWYGRLDRAYLVCIIIFIQYSYLQQVRIGLKFRHLKKIYFLDFNYDFTLAIILVDRNSLKYKNNSIDIMQWEKLKLLKVFVDLGAFFLFKVRSILYSKN